MGAIFGVAAIVSMVVIGFDRYNVIVKGMDLSLLGYYTTCTNPNVTCFQKIRGRKCRLQKMDFWTCCFCLMCLIDAMLLSR